MTKRICDYDIEKEYIRRKEREAKGLDPDERLGFFDIEACNLNGNWGYMLSYCIKPDDSNHVIKRLVTQEDIRKYRFDRVLCKQFIKDCTQFDRLVTYYGTGFDLKFVRTRSVGFNYDFPKYKKIYHTDVYYIVKGRFKFHSNRLEVACDFFGIDSKDHPMHPGMWMKALAGHPPSLDYILKHNVEDVYSLEKLYYKVKDFAQKTRRSI